MADERSDKRITEGAAPGKKLSAAAERALEEAAARRAAGETLKHRQKERELGGKKGPEPVRYGDWEAKGGIISDF